MNLQQNNQQELNKGDVSTIKKESWSAPVIVPLDVNLTENNPGEGFDGGFFDSSLS